MACAGVIVVALVATLVIVVRQGSGTAGGIPASPRIGPARDVYDGDLGDPFVLPVISPGQATRFVAFGTGDWPARCRDATELANRITSNMASRGVDPRPEETGPGEILRKVLARTGQPDEAACVRGE